MSLILDALRKSEAERRRGQAPDLFASLPAPNAPSRGVWPRYWAVLALGLLLIAAGFVFWQGRALHPAAVAGADDQGAAVPTPAAAAPPSRSEHAPPAAVASGAPPAPIPVSPGTPAPDRVAATMRPTAPPAATGTPASGTAPTAPAPVARRPPPPPTPATALAIAPAPAPAPLPAPPPTPAPAVAATAASSQDDGAESLPPIAVLGASERAALPPLKLSMHVWNSEPGKRFAIIDGHRLTEGSSAGASVVEEIRRDGVVLNINGRRVLLPRP